MSGDLTSVRYPAGAVALETWTPFTGRRPAFKRVLATASPDPLILSPRLITLARGCYWQSLLDDGVVGSGSEFAQREGLHHSTVNELLRRTLLEPAIIQTILAGQQPRGMNLLWFQRNPLPTDWVGGGVLAGFDV